jgi:hypothetical protein
VKIKIPDKKFCSKCKFLTHIDNFYKQNGRPVSWCKACSKKDALRRYEKDKEAWNIRSRNWKRAHKLRNKEYYLIYAYGITLEDYNKMFEEQQGCCAICGRHQSELKRALAVDHSHETGKVRGLLCGKCNHALGNVNDDISILLSMIEYLNED